MNDLRHADDYPEIPVSLRPSRDTLTTGGWRSMRPERIDRLAPCTAGCPASVPVPRYFHHLAAGRLDEAFAVFSELNPFPSITGRLCPHACEHDCNRRGSGSVISIRAIERYLGDTTLHQPHTAPRPDTGRTVAVIGSGAEGLAAAYYLRRSGHAVVVFEPGEQVGGALRTATPAFRLPVEILDAEVARLEAMGIEFRAGIDPEALNRSGYDHVVVTGREIAEVPPDTPGYGYLRSGLDLLAAVAAGERSCPGVRCAVVGASTTGLDVARTLHRLGADVTVVFDGTNREIPAERESYLRAVKEGIHFVMQTTLESVEKDEGRPALTLRSADGVGRVTFDAVFSGTATVCGPPTVADAIAAGRRAALAVNDRIGGGYPQPEWLTTIGEVVTLDEVNAAYVASGPRVREHASAGGDNLYSDESATLTEEEALAELERCLSCGVCNECGTCFVFCPDAAIRWIDGPVIDYEHCKGCGICVVECPGHAITYVNEREPANA